MKKHLIILIGIITFSCSQENDFIDSYSDPLPIVLVEFPDEIEVGETYEVNIIYSRITKCHAFNNILLQEHDNERNVVVFGIYFKSNGDCTPLGTELEASFNIKETEVGTYTYNFWQGEDENGDSIYLTKEVEVVE